VTQEIVQHIEDDDFQRFVTICFIYFGSGRSSLYSQAISILLEQGLDGRSLHQYLEEVVQELDRTWESLSSAYAELRGMFAT